MENNNKSIASLWFNSTQPQAVQPETQPQTQAPAEQKDNPVRHQYRQTLLNGLKGESYV